MKYYSMLIEIIGSFACIYMFFFVSTPTSFNPMWLCALLLWNIAGQLRQILEVLRAKK